eukprot:COSAG02_NODE_48306_length_334_cov_1.527660_1_plen_39_part_10
MPYIIGSFGVICTTCTLLPLINCSCTSVASRSGMLFGNP